MIALEDAVCLAATLHKNQVDKQGEPYILHPLRVMLSVPDFLRVTAVLHDVLEDCDITAEQLALVVEDEWTMDRLDNLTHRHNEPRPLYIGRVTHAPESVIVKCADLMDNASRLHGLNDDTRSRLADKYSRDAVQICQWYEERGRLPGEGQQLTAAISRAADVVFQRVG